MKKELFIGVVLVFLVFGLMLNFVAYRNNVYSKGYSDSLIDVVRVREGEITVAEVICERFPHYCEQKEEIPQVTKSLALMGIFSPGLTKEQYEGIRCH